MFYARLYMPRWSMTPYEKLTQDVVNANLNQDSETYKSLLKLKKAATKVAASIGQLRAITEINEWKEWEDLLLVCLKHRVAPYPSVDSEEQMEQFDPRNLNQLRKRFTSLRNEIKNEKRLLYFSCFFNMLSNATLFLIAAGATAGMAAALTGPIGMALLAVAVALLGAAIAVWSAYNLYVDARFLMGKQLQEIDQLITDFESSFARQNMDFENSLATHNIDPDGTEIVQIAGRESSNPGNLYRTRP